MFSRLNLTTKMVGLAILGLVAVIAAFVIVSQWTLDQTTKKTLQERLLIAEIAAKSIDHYNRSIWNHLEEIAASIGTDPGQGGQAQTGQVLKSARARLGAREMFLLDGDGRVMAIDPIDITGIQGNLSTYRYVTSAYFARQPRVSSIVPSILDREPVITYIAPMRRADGTVSGAIGANIDLNQPNIRGFIEAISLGKTGYAQVVDENGDLIASTQPTEVFGKSDHGDRFVGLIQDRKKVVSTCHSCHDPGEAPGKRKDVMAFVPLSTASWGIAVRQAEAEALDPTQRLRVRMMTVAGASLAIASGFSFLFVRRLLRPIHRLTESANRIAAGDFSGTIESKGRDEIAGLGRTFDAMRMQLQSSRREIEERSADLERRNQELSALNSIATAVGGSLDLRESLDSALEEVLAIMNCDAGGIFIEEAEGHLPLASAQIGLSEHLVNFVLRPHESDTLAEGIGQMRIKSANEGSDPLWMITVRLLSKDRPQGRLILVTERPLEAGQVRLLVAIGHQIGVAVDNARLFGEAQLRQRESVALYRIGVEILALRDVDKILNLVVKNARELLRADVSILSLIDSNGNSIYIRATSGVRQEEFTSQVIGPGRGFAGKVIDQGRAVAVEDYLNDPSVVHDEKLYQLVKEEGLRSHLGIPLMVADRVIGALTVARRRVDKFGQRETDLLWRLGNQAALAIEAARLYKEIQDKEEQRGQLLERVISVQEDERRRIARELHDGLIQNLTGLAMQLESLETELAPQSDQIGRMLAKDRALTVRTIEDTRRLIADLRPTALDDLGLVPAIRWYAASHLEKQGVEVSVDAAAMRSMRVAPSVETALFRVAQEAINNIAKHADCCNVRISLGLHDSLVKLSIEDDGRGFDIGEASKSEFAEVRVGLVGMRERMTLLGGTLHIDSHPGKGTRVTVEVPLPEEETDGKDQNTGGG